MYETETGINFKTRFIVTIAATLTATILGNYSQGEDKQDHTPQPEVEIIKIIESENF